MSGDLMPLRYGAEVLVSNVDKKSVDGEQAVRLVNYTDVYYQDVVRPDLPLMAATATSGQISRFALRVGDSIITKDSETPDDIGVPTFVADTAPDMLCGYHLAIVRPRSAVSGRFFSWALRSDFVRGQLAVAANGMTRYGLTYDAIQSVLIPVAKPDEQRRIADFLDDQVARIDNIIAARGLQRRLFAERSAALLQELLADYGCHMHPGEAIETQRLTLPAGWRIAELGHVIRQLTNGYVGPTRDLLVDEGVRYIQSLHIKNGRIDFERRPYFVPRDWHLDRPRIHLRPEDVLIVQTGDIGQIAVVPEDIDEASCHALLIARVERGVITGKFLGEYLRTPAGQQELLSRATGALHPHLESGIKAAPVVVPPVDTQRQAVAEVDVRRDQLESLDAALARSTAELAELKRSLITAAVTGEFDMSSADGSRVLV